MIYLFTTIGLPAAVSEQRLGRLDLWRTGRTGGRPEELRGGGRGGRGTRRGTRRRAHSLTGRTAVERKVHLHEFAVL